ncbi:hypothetical protein [Helicobacter felistomachi]|uniref:hypothetical protein n=1 Tax=Helicobacter felistomachi TaxID=3040201 RepID=UPI0025737D30|nr:hypothetical protein [Helicobacter sp. NHP21005]
MNEPYLSKEIEKISKRVGWAGLIQGHVAYTQRTDAKAYNSYLLSNLTGNTDWILETSVCLTRKSSK